MNALFNSTHPPLVRRRLLIGVFALLLSACGGGGTNVAGDGPTGQDPPAPSSQPARECGGEGFPCALSEVAPAVLQRGEQLADEVTAKLDAGGTMAAAVAFLWTQTDVADAASQGAALRFRLRGGRDVFILPANGPAPAAAAAVAKAQHARPPLTPLLPAPSVPPAAREGAHKVVGASVTSKRALVLSPFKYQFGALDDGLPVSQLLQGTRGYAGQVVYMENATRSATTVGIQQFLGWEAFDVIHATSHGAQVCDLEHCVSTILSGDSYRDADDLLRITELGVNTARVRGSDEKFVSLSPAFFKAKYPQGLAGKIIFFNACQTYWPAGSGLSDVLLGAQSIFLGWSEVVMADAARDAALALFKKLSQDGVTVRTAADGLGDLAFNRYQRDGEEVTAILLLDYALGTDLRLREVATLERPDTGGALLPNAVVNAVGKAQDGVVDGVPYQILIEGIPKSQEDAAIVQFIVNGHSSTPQAVTIGERIGETGWRLRGQIPFVDVSPEQVVEMLARVSLPDGGMSEHRVSVRLVSEPPATAETWVGEAVSHFDDSTPEGQVHITRVATVTFKQSAATIGGRYKVLRSTGGTLAWTRSGSIKTLLDGTCHYAGPTVQVPIDAGDGEIIIDTAAVPDSYSMSGFTTGVEVRVAENCGNYAFSTRAGGAWAPALGHADGFVASPDGGTVSGSAGANLSTWQWTFRRQ